MSGPARTRDCLDPWTTVYVKADGEVAPCCWARPIGNLERAPVEEILAGDQALALRRQMLSGELPEDCRACPARDWTDTATLEERVRDLARQDERLRLVERLGGFPRDQARLRALHDRRAALLREREALEAGGAVEGGRRAELDRELADLERRMIALERGIGRLVYRKQKPVRWLVRRAWTRARRRAGAD